MLEQGIMHKRLNKAWTRINGGQLNPPNYKDAFGSTKLRTPPTKCKLPVTSTFTRKLFVAIF